MENVINWKLILHQSDKEEEIAAFQFLIENKKVWLNNFEVIEDLQKQGIATLIIKEAIKSLMKCIFRMYLRLSTKE